MIAIIIYWSNMGNTEKVAFTIHDGLEEAGVNVTTKRVEDAGDIDYFDYDLVCIGFPSHQWHPPEPMDAFLNSKHRAYRRQGRGR